MIGRGIGRQTKRRRSGKHSWTTVPQIRGRSERGHQSAEVRRSNECDQVIHRCLVRPGLATSTLCQPSWRAREIGVNVHCSAGLFQGAPQRLRHGENPVGRLRACYPGSDGAMLVGGQQLQVEHFIDRLQGVSSVMRRGRDGQDARPAPSCDGGLVGRHQAKPRDLRRSTLGCHRFHPNAPHALERLAPTVLLGEAVAKDQSAHHGYRGISGARSNYSAVAPTMLLNAPRERFASGSHHIAAHSLPLLRLRLH